MHKFIDNIVAFSLKNKFFRQLYINLHQLCKNTALYLHLV